MFIASFKNSPTIARKSATEKAAISAVQPGLGQIPARAESGSGRHEQL